jgi:hypothetical protein
MASSPVCLQVDMLTPMATQGSFPTTVVTLPTMGQGKSLVCDAVAKGSLACQILTPGKDLKYCSQSLCNYTVDSG